MPDNGEPPRESDLDVGMQMTEKERGMANLKLMTYLDETLANGMREVKMLQRKLAFSYWISVALSILMFLVGLILLSVPFITAFYGKGTEWQSAISGSLGIVDLVALFLIGPLNRIHKLMGNIAQVTIAINSFQNQVALRLLELNKDDRKSIGKAAKYIDNAARESIELIQQYFEEKPAEMSGIDATDNE